MPLFSFDKNNLKATVERAKKWVGRGVEDSTDKLFLYDEIYLYTGGGWLQSENYLFPEYKFCIPLTRQVGDLFHICGYIFYDFSSFVGLQIPEVAITAEFGDKFGLYFQFPDQTNAIVYDPIDDKYYNNPRGAVVTRSIPARAPLCADNHDMEGIAFGPKYLGVLEFCEKNGIEIGSYDFVQLVRSSENMSAADKFRFIGRAFRNQHFLIGGTVEEMPTGHRIWPYSNPILPEFDNDINFPGTKDHNTAQFVSGLNFLRNIPFHTKIYRLTRSQETAIQSSLITIGKTEDIRQPFEVVSNITTSRTRSGTPVTFSGGIRVAGKWLYFVAAQGELRTNEIVEQCPSGKTGVVAGVLWKHLNHAYYVSPEKQKGIGLVIEEQSHVR